MGTYGSTRWHGHVRRRTVTEALALEARGLARDCIFPDVAGLHSFDVTIETGGSVSHDDITIEAVAQPFGGVRWWCRCSGCGHRRRALYSVRGAKIIRCRTCFGLAYESQRLGTLDRLSHRVLKLSRRLGSTDPVFVLATAIPPEKPRGMHERTYTLRVLTLGRVLDARIDTIVAIAARYTDSRFK
jgi:hypothetical protein